MTYWGKYPNTFNLYTTGINSFNSFLSALCFSKFSMLDKNVVLIREKIKRNMVDKKALLTGEKIKTIFFK